MQFQVQAPTATAAAVASIHLADAPECNFTIWIKTAAQCTWNSYQCYSAFAKKLIQTCVLPRHENCTFARQMHSACVFVWAQTNWFSIYYSTFNFPQMKEQICYCQKYTESTISLQYMGKIAGTAHRTTKNAIILWKWNTIETEKKKQESLFISSVCVCMCISISFSLRSSSICALIISRALSLPWNCCCFFYIPIRFVYKLKTNFICKMLFSVSRRSAERE